MTAEQQRLGLYVDDEPCPVCGGTLTRLVVAPDRRICETFDHLVVDSGEVLDHGKPWTP